MSFVQRMLHDVVYYNIVLFAIVFLFLLEECDEDIQYDSDDGDEE